MTKARAANSRQTRGKIAFKTGHTREFLAALLLRAKGYRILGQRLRTPFGEVDILASKGDTLIVVEVKSRKEMDAAHGAILEAQQRRLQNAALHLAAYQRQNFAVIRCDAFLFGSRSWPAHIKNAFESP